MLKNIVNEIVNKALLTEITVKDAYPVYYKDIEQEVFQEIVQASQGNNNILLPITKWVLQCYKNDPEDTMNRISNLRTDRNNGYLDIWDRLKSRQFISGNDADITRFKTIKELYWFINEFDNAELFKRTKKEWSKDAKAAKDDIERCYEDNEWLVISPNSIEASCYWGSGTEWCTATRDEDENMYHSYADSDPLFIVINKNTREKYQFCFGQEEYRDAKDETIKDPILKTIGANKGLTQWVINYCQSEGYDWIYFIYEIIGTEHEGLVPVKLGENEYNLINADNELAYPDMTFLTPTKVEYEWTPVRFKTKGDNQIHTNLMSYDGSFLFEDGFLLTTNPESQEFALVSRAEDGRINYVNLRNGDFVSDTWFKSGDDYNFQKLAVVYDDDNLCNLLDKNGKLLSDVWLNLIKKTENESLYLINKETKYNLLRVEGLKKGTTLLPEWVSKIMTLNDYHNIFACFRNIDMKNPDIFVIDNMGRIFQDNLTYVSLMYRNFGSLLDNYCMIIKKDGKANLLTTQGVVLLDKWADDIKQKEIKRKHQTIAVYGDKKFIVRQDDFREKASLEEIGNNVNENKMLEIAKKINDNLNDALLCEINIRDAYAAYYKYVPEHDYEEIIGRLQPETDEVKYTTKWVLKMYKNYPTATMSHIRTGLLHNDNGTGFLDIFHRAKTLHLLQGRENDINSYTRFSQMRDVVSRFNVAELQGNNTQRKKNNMTDEQKAAKNDIDVVYQDEKWFVLVPKSYEASVYWGSDTKWCTAYKDSRHYYDSYSKKGKLYININKETREKYQFHFETDSFMDSEDETIMDPILERIDATEGLRNFYKETIPQELFEYLEKPDLFEIVESVSSYIFIGKKMSKQRSNYPYSLTGEYTFIGVNDEILHSTGFDEWKRYPGLGIKTYNHHNDYEDFYSYETNGCFSSFYDITDIEIYEDTNSVMASRGMDAYLYRKGKNTIKKPQTFRLERAKEFNGKMFFALYDEDMWMWFFYDGDFVLDEPVEDFLRFDGEYIKYENDDSMHLMDIYGNKILPDDYEYQRIITVNENLFFVRFKNEKLSILVDKELNKQSKYRFISNRRKTIPNGGGNMYLVEREDNKFNILLSDGIFLSPYIWFDEIDGNWNYYCTPPNEKQRVQCTFVRYADKNYYLDMEGRIYDEECNFLSYLNDGSMRVESRKYLLKSINENLNNIFKL